MIRLLRSTSFRIALIYSCLILVSALALTAVLWWRTAGYVDRQIEAVILADTRAIGDGWREFGITGALNIINDRVKRNSDEHAIYLLTDANFSPISGNIEGWPLKLSQQAGWFEVSLVRTSTIHVTRLLHVALPNGFHLIVGRDVQERAGLRSALWQALLWAVVAAALLAIAGGVIVRRIVLSRISGINHTAGAIIHGDLDRRIPVSRAGDEFDQLAATINGMLDQIHLLIEGAQHTSDAIAHDLRTPLTVLRTRLESAIRKSTTGEAVGELQGALNSVDELVEIFNALLRLADIKSGTRRSGFREFDLGAVVGDMAELYAPLAEEKGLRFSSKSMTGIILNGDPHLIAQALGNLLDNAIKFTPPGGNVSLITRRQTSGDAEICVADTGPGISETDKPRVRRQFERGADYSVPGVGLGLSLAEAVAALHNGALELNDNHPGLAACLVLPNTAH